MSIAAAPSDGGSTDPEADVGVEEVASEAEPGGAGGELVGLPVGEGVLQAATSAMRPSAAARARRAAA